MSGIWPGDTRLVATLSFDVDGVSGAINRNPDTARYPSTMSLREYGPSIGTPRILDLLKRYQITATFFIPGYVAETHESLVWDIKNQGHEIAHHGYMHEPPVTLSRQQEEAILDKGISILERITGEPPKGYRSPSWELTEYSLELLSERGFLYDASMMGNDIPYLVNVNNTQIVEVPGHWELDDVPYFNFSPSLGTRPLMATPDHVFQVWSSAFEGLYHFGKSFVLTMHPFCIGRPSKILMLERLIQYICEYPGVEFMSAAALADLFSPQTPNS